MGRKKRKKSGPLRKVSTGEISSQVWEISLNGVGSGASNTFRASSSLVDKIRGQGTNVYLNGTEHILYLPSNLSEKGIISTL